jgi:L-ascorbate metabolism protein UlaG (beta-lactamase superfamily)
MISREAQDEFLWINHAGYELRSAGVRIVYDPWLIGRAFADSWALVSETAYERRILPVSIISGSATSIPTISHPHRCA